MVPATALLGPTGLWIRSRLNGNPNGPGDACLIFGSGETEDYTVTIGPAPARAPPTGLAVGNTTPTGPTLGFGGTTAGPAAGYVVQYGLSGFAPGGPGSSTALAPGRPLA